MNEQQQKLESIRQQVEANMIAKAWEDESYKKELLTNSKAVIEREFNFQLPDEVSVTVLEENSSNLYFTIPNCPAEVSEEALSEHELEAVAGGGPLSAIGGGLLSAGGTLLSGGSASDAIGNGLMGATLGMMTPLP